MSGSTKCPHPDAHIHINVAEFGDTNLKYLEVHGFCKVCDTKIIFRGVPPGVNPNAPACDIMSNEIRLPFVFEDEEYDGKGVGFSVTGHG